MKTTEMIYKLHQYCLDNNLSVVYYHFSGHTRSVEICIEMILSRGIDPHWDTIVIEQFDMTIHIYELWIPGWETIKSRLDYLVLTRTFA